MFAGPLQNGMGTGAVQCCRWLLTQGLQAVHQIGSRRGQGNGLGMGLLGKFLSICIDDDRQVRVVRVRQGQHRLQVPVSKGGFQQIAAAYDMRNALIGIVQYHRQVIGIQVVFALDNKVAALLLQIAVQGPLQCVFEMDIGILDLQPDSMGL